MRYSSLSDALDPESTNAIMAEDRTPCPFHDVVRMAKWERPYAYMARPEVRKKLSDSNKRVWQENDWSERSARIGRTMQKVWANRTKYHQSDPAWRKARSEQYKGRKWWTDGKGKSTQAHECPEGWRRGRK